MVLASVSKFVKAWREASVRVNSKKLILRMESRTLKISSDEHDDQENLCQLKRED